MACRESRSVTRRVRPGCSTNLAALTVVRFPRSRNANVPRTLPRAASRVDRRRTTLRLGVTLTDRGEIASVANGALEVAGGPLGAGCGGGGEVRGPLPAHGLRGASLKSFAARFV
jgi:hypothetical protein